MVLELTRRRFSVAEYYKMAEAGILGEDDRVELIDGEIIEMTPIDPRHAGDVDLLHEFLVHTFADVATIRGQNPIRLSEYTEPQPDLALLRRRQDFYRSGHPTPEDILLVVEVADTSVELDQQVKAPLYARAGIREYWLVDLNHQIITVYRDPAPDGYRFTQLVRRGEKVAALAFPDREFSVADILG